jgi:hypothetical protein
LSYLATVAKVTAWSMDFILWGLPYATGLGLVHAAAVRNGQAMEFAVSRGEEEPEEDLRARFARMRGDQ